jgi:hypothetical protein
LFNRVRRLALLPILAALCLAAPPQHACRAEDATDAIEKDLLGILKEMDALSAELERIEEIAVTPRPTSIRVEIRKGGAVPVPVAWKLFIGGKLEMEREWSKGERERFQSDSEPLVLNAPLLPGTHEVRLELSYPLGKRPVVHDVVPTVGAGETFRIRLTLTLPAGKQDPALVSGPVK